MKKICIVLIAVFSINQINAQYKMSNELLKTENKVRKLDLDKKVTEAFDINLSDFETITDDVLFDNNFEIKNANNLKTMLKVMVDARKKGKVSKHIWDNLEIGSIFNNRILEDGKINTDDFIGELPGGNNTNLDIASEFRGKNNKVGPGSNKSGDLMNPAGNIGQGGENGFKGVGGNDAFGTLWSVESSHFSSKDSNGSSTTTFIHHHDEVSNDNGYSSTTDKQTFIRGDGSSTTRTVVTQTQSDGSSKSSVTTETKDSDGNTHSTTTYTEKDSDGDITDQKTTEKNEKEDNDDESWDPENPDGNCYKTPPPTDEEIQSAIYRALAVNGFAGGRGDDRTGQKNDNISINQFSPDNIQNKEGYMENKKVGGKINANKVLKQQQVTNPGVKGKQ